MLRSRQLVLPSGAQLENISQKYIFLSRTFSEVQIHSPSTKRNFVFLPETHLKSSTWKGEKQLILHLCPVCITEDYIGVVVKPFIRKEQKKDTWYAGTFGALNKSFSCEWSRKEVYSCKVAVGERKIANHGSSSYSCLKHTMAQCQHTKHMSSFLCSPFFSVPLQQTIDLQQICCVPQTTGERDNKVVLAIALR